MTAPAPEPVRFGRYRLLHRIGAGGMAEVFRARSEGASGVGKELAIKRIQPEHCADPDFVEMFIDEARVAVLLQHPCLVQVFDFGEVEGQFFMAMELVDGISLLVLVRELARRRQRLPADLALHVAFQIARALDYAHNLTGPDGGPLALVHRDICPANVLISQHGDVKLTDFGIARSSLRSTSTEDDSPKGHLAYMSPEQARGLPVDHRSDLFSLGVLLHELLTGHRLLKQSTSSGTLARLLNDALPLPSELSGHQSIEIDAVVMGLLERNPDLRTPSAAALIAALTPLLGTPAERCRQLLAGHTRELVAQLPPPSPSSSQPSTFISDVREETTQLHAPVRRRWPWLLLLPVVLLLGVVLWPSSPEPPPDLPPAPVEVVAPEPVKLVTPESVEPMVEDEDAVEEAAEGTSEDVIADVPADAVPDPVEDIAAPVIAPRPAAPAPAPAAAPAAEAEAVEEVPAAPTASGPGQVTVTITNGWGFLTLDGKSIRRKRGEPIVLQVEPGLHLLQLRQSSSSRVLSRQIEVGAGEAAEVVFDLSR